MPKARARRPRLHLVITGIIPLFWIGRPSLDVKEIESRLIALETRNAVDDVHRGNVGERLGAIEDALSWLVRLIIGGLLVAALTYAVQGGLVG